MKPSKTDDIDISEYNHPTGGWGSLKSLLKKSRAEGLLASDIWATLLKQNKADGYMCVSCSWAKPKDAREFEFCENGAKATIWEQTKKRCTPEFFENHTLAELREWPDHDLEKAGSPHRTVALRRRHRSLCAHLLAGSVRGHRREAESARSHLRRLLRVGPRLARSIVHVPAFRPRLRLAEPARFLQHVP